MAYTPIMPSMKLNAQDAGVPDYVGSLARGYQAGSLPAMTSADLLNKALKAKYDAFKAGPDYQSAMLDFLRGQGAHMAGETANLPAQRQLIEAQAGHYAQGDKLAEQKARMLQQWMGGIGDNSQANVSAEGPGVAASPSAYDTFPGRRKGRPGPAAQQLLDEADANGMPTHATNAGYGREGSPRYIDALYQQTPVGMNTTAPNKISEDFEKGNADYQKERAMAAILGLKEPATEVDPETGVKYAYTRQGKVAIGQGASETQKAAAKELGSAKGKEEASFVAENPRDRKVLKDLMSHVEKLNGGEFDAALGWKHHIPYGANFSLSDKQIGDISEFENTLNALRAKQGSIFKGQGAVSDYERRLLSSTLPNINDNPTAFKAQMNKFVKDMMGDQMQRHLITQYRKDGMSFEDAKDKASRTLEESLPTQQEQAPQQSGYKNAMFRQVGDQYVPMNDENAFGEISREAGPQSIQGPSEASRFVQEAKKYAPYAGDIAAAGLLQAPHPLARAAGGALALGQGAYEAVPGKRIQGALENLAIAAVPGALGKVLGKVSSKGIAKEAIKNTEKLFQKRVAPFERVEAQANKLGDLKVPAQIGGYADKLKAALAGHERNWSRELNDLTRFKNNPSFKNAQKAQSGLGQIERANVDESVRSTARDLRKRMLGSMQQHLTKDPQLLSEYSSGMKGYAESGPLLKSLQKASRTMTPKDYVRHLQSLSKQGKLPEDMREIMSGIERRQGVKNAVGFGVRALGPGLLPGAGIAYKLGDILRGI